MIDKTRKPYRIEITPNPDLKTGPFSAVLVLSLISQDGRRQYGATLPVKGRVQPRMRLLPTRLILAARPVGAVAKGQLTIQHAKGAAFAYESVQSTNPSIEVRPLPDKDGTIRHLEVSLKTERAGLAHSSLLFSFRDGAQIHTVEVQVLSEGYDSN